MSVDSPIIVALDYPDMDTALAMAVKLNPAKCRVKVGKELFTAEGPAVIKALKGKGFEVFLDLKFHDIPNTASKAVVASAKLGVWMVNIHACGGVRMMRACREALDKLGLDNPPLLIAVTVLTSMDRADLEEQDIQLSPQEQVIKLALLAKNAGMDGVVCSAEEAKKLKVVCGEGFILVSPGIRPGPGIFDDQRRVTTPQQAVKNGSDYLVVGRPVTQAADPKVAVEEILAGL